MTVIRLLFVCIASLFAMCAWSNPVIARNRIPVENADYRVVSCPKGKTGTCVQIVNREGNNFTASEFAAAFGTTGQAIRAENPETTIPLCKKNGWKEPLYRGMLSRRTQEYWKNDCPNESQQDAYLVPGEIIVISGKPHRSFNQRMELMRRLEECTDAEACVEILKLLAPDAKRMGDIYIIKQTPTEVRSSVRAVPPTLPVPHEIAEEPLLTAGQWIWLFVIIGVTTGILLLIRTNYLQRRSIRHLVATHQKWVRDANARYALLDGEYGRLQEWLDMTVTKTDELTGLTLSENSELSVRARRCIHAVRETIVALKDAAKTVGTNPTGGVGETLLALMVSNSALSRENATLRIATEDLINLNETVNSGMRSLYEQMTRRSSESIPAGSGAALRAVQRATDELTRSLHCSIELLAQIVFGKMPTQVEESVRFERSIDSSGIDSVAHVLRDINRELAELCNQPLSSPLLQNLRLLVEGQQGTVAMYRERVTKQAAIIADAQLRLRLAQEKLDERKSDDPPESGTGGERKSPITLTGLPRVDEKDIKWHVVDSASKDLIHAMRGVVVEKRDVEIRNPKELQALYRVWLVLSRLRLFFPTAEQTSGFSGSHSFQKIANHDTIVRLKEMLALGAKPVRAQGEPTLNLVAPLVARFVG